MKAKKLLALILALTFVLSLGTFDVLAKAEPVTVDVYIVSQLMGRFLSSPLELKTVSSDLAESYGFEDNVDGVSALDALVREHELVYGDGFSPDTAGDYLAVSYGSPAKAFGVESSDFYSGFMLNGGYPNDGTETSYGYNGTLVATQEIKDGDKIDFFFYEDPSYGDTYTWIDGALSVLPGEDAEVTVTGSFVMNGSSYKTPADFEASASPLEDANFAWVGENGKLTEIDDVYSDEDGNAVIPIPSDMEPGTYYLTVTADGDDYIFLCLMNPTPITVTNETTPDNPTNIAVTGLTLSDSLTVYENGKAEIDYAVEPQDASDKSVLWESSDESVATVTDGVVKGIKAGSAEITATTNDGGFSKKCTVTVEELPAELYVLHSIAAKYAESGIAKDYNAPWFAADLANYLCLFPDTENRLSLEQIQEYLDVLIPAADTAKTAGDLSKYIIALRALGFDPTDIITSDFRHINIVERLKTLIDENDSSVTSIYNLPYVIIAMNEDEAYLDTDGMEALISSAVEQKDAWLDTFWGTYSADVMAVALAPFKDRENVKAALDEAVKIIEGADFTDAETTSLELAALSSVGIDGAEIKKDGVSFVDFILTQTNEILGGSNSFATEQAMRGILAHQLLVQNKEKALFDFSDSPKNAAEATWAENCPVKFSVIPENAVVTVEGQDAKSAGRYDLPAGTYSYTVSKSGYKDAEGTFTVTDGEDANHTPKTLNISLSSEPSSGGKGISVTVNVLTHDKTQCGGAYTYKNNKSAYTELIGGTVALTKGQTVFDALDALLSGKVNYIESSYGYISAIGKDAEFDHGPNSGWHYMVDGKPADVGCRDKQLFKNCTVTWFYTDDYTADLYADWTKGKGGVSLAKNDENNLPSAAKDTVPYSDISENDWYYDAVLYAYQHGLMIGTGDSFEPENKMTRAMLITVLYRLEENDKTTAECQFQDVSSDDWFFESVAWGAENGIILGISDTDFAPNENVSREQTALILSRYAKMKNYYTENYSDLSGFDDKDAVSSWAIDAMKWANGEGIITGITDSSISPKTSTTRAQAAELLMRFFKLYVK